MGLHVGALHHHLVLNVLGLGGGGIGVDLGEGVGLPPDGRAAHAAREDEEQGQRQCKNTVPFSSKYLLLGGKTSLLL